MAKDIMCAINCFNAIKIFVKKVEAYLTVVDMSLWGTFSIIKLSQTL